MRTLLSGGQVVTPSGVFHADVLLEDGKIRSLVRPASGPDCPAPPADDTIDVRGKLLFPGGVDAHTHLDLPVGAAVSADDFESGTIAAAIGGTTTILDFPTQERGGSLARAVTDWHRRADGRAVIDYGFHAIIVDAPPAVLGELPGLCRDGVTSFKLFMAYPDRLMLDDGAILRVLEAATAAGALVQVHAETGDAIEVLVRRALAEGRSAPIEHARTRPEATEVSAIDRAIALAEILHAPLYVVHVSTARGADRIRSARAAGLPVLGETCPQYLTLDETRLAGSPDDPFAGARFTCTPPLRARENHAPLWRALARGDLQVVATDHCPFRYEDKKLGRQSFAAIPSGVPGIETRLLLLWQGVRRGVLSVERFVDLVATAPARVFGLFPRKGAILPGADADLVVWNPERRVSLSQRDLHMSVDYSLYEGQEVIGGPDLVLSRGRVLVRDGAYVGGRAGGEFLKRGAPSIL